ncbi:MAG TPA: winged helix-turn-helix domain-containing protein [Solirubrobacterales bacterium]|nr:winged helix-turn-helix domain-containing protein [Solirubrobacterales bacterium]
MQGERKLPAGVAALLAPHLCRALDHQTRRQIIRALNHSERPQTPKDLAEAIPGAGLSRIGYHTLVLEECGCVTVTAAPSPVGGLRRAYLSNVTDNRLVTSALQATRHLDEFCV